MSYCIITKADKFVSIDQASFNLLRQILVKPRNERPEWIDVNNQPIKVNEILEVKEIVSETQASTLKEQEYRKNWERLSQMSVIPKVTREMGRCRLVWEAVKQIPWDEKIRNQFELVAADFFHKNPKRTVCDSMLYKDIYGEVDRPFINEQSKLVTKRIVDLAIEVYEVNDLIQIKTPYEYNVEAFTEWPDPDEARIELQFENIL